MKYIDEIPTPAVLIQEAALQRNIKNMQTICAANDVQLWPHCKTHKLVPVLRRQLAAGAIGATCAKVSEAEALLPSGVRRIFLAHSLATSLIVPRLTQLISKLDELILAVTSEAYFEVLDRLLKRERLQVSVLMAVDTGLNREGVRSTKEALRLYRQINESPRMKFRGIYTHEGQIYAENHESFHAAALKVLQTLENYSEALGGEIPLWPGCSASASYLAGTGKVYAVRPGAYIFGDLYLSEVTPIMPEEDVAISILTTVVDRPTSDLALIDAGSKTLSGDKTPKNAFARVLNTDLIVTRLSEEHGFIHLGRRDLKIGTRLRCIPAHVCPVMNLTSKVYLVDKERILETWAVDARGCNF